MYSLLFAASATASFIDVAGFLATQVETDVNLYKSMVPAGQNLVYAGFTIGGINTQNYDCTNGKYVLSGANATINFGDAHHFFLAYGGKPTWSNRDGSMVTGLGKTVFPSPQGPSNVAWLSVTPTQTSGNGVFSNVKTVLRTFTYGGSAPSSCTSGSIKVPYSALYTFYA
ncbi:hypothetical protein HK103_001115 [Boothiomyces macroporosus]|uniref:Malate dehydrogenase n=1 Tax=Boothiomyces macroporosus TaxID=261099 RepID=A0AAD5UEY9_9FUNG|nr:hypothetical protein HK103_001115 [Boothiomyces macroporosus]